MAEVWTRGYLLLMLGMFPVWVGWSGYSHLTAQKFGFFLMATVLWLAGLLVCNLRDRRPGRPITAGQVLALLLALAMGLSALCSPYGTATLLGGGRYDGLCTWVLYAAMFWGVSRYARPRWCYAWALALGSVVNCTVAAVQLLGYNCLWLFPAGLTYYDAGTAYTGEFLGLIGNVDVLAAYFCLTIPVFLGLFVTLGGRRTWLLAAAAGVNWCILLKSGVAGGLAGLGLAMLIGAPMVITNRHRLARGILALGFLTGIAGSVLGMVWLLPVAAGLLGLVWLLHRSGWEMGDPGRLLAVVECLAVAGALGVLYAVPPASGTLGELSMLLHGQVEDSFGSNRVTIWKEVWRLIRERPLLGGGPDTLGLRTELGFTRYAENGTKLAVHVDNAHNEYLNLWVNGGLLALMPYLGLMIATVRQWWRRRDRGVAGALCLGLTAWWGQGLFGLGLCIVSPLLWICWGMAWKLFTDPRQED